MAQPRKPTVDPDESPRGDPWHAVGYLVSGVALYGLLGWGLDRMLGTTWLVALGIVFGAVLGLYLTWVRFMMPRPVAPPTPTDETRQETR